jgi:hypothetical protein
MNIKKDLFTQIGTYLMATLKSFPTELDLPDLAWFDKQMDQFTNPELAYAIPLPCILMEYRQFEWQNVGKNQQRGNGNIRFYIYFEKYADTFDGAVDLGPATRFFDFTEQVNIALQGFSLPNMTALTRVSDNNDGSANMVITGTVDYGTIIIDATTDEERQFVLVDPDVTVTRVDTTTRPAAHGYIDGFLT